MQEILYASSDPNESRKLSKLLKEGAIFKVAPRIYSSNFDLGPEALIQKNLYQIIEHFYPESVLSHRSAFEIRPHNNVLYLSGRKRTQVKLPGLTLQFVDETAHHSKDKPFLGLYIAHEGRAYLENLTPSREKGESRKNLTNEEIEKRLLAKLELGGEVALNTLRDEARVYSKNANLINEFKILDGMIGALLGTREKSFLANTRSQAFLQGNNYDEERIALFTQYIILAKDMGEGIVQDERMKNPEHFKNKAFFESYFSNFIEGTEFEIDEAEEIVFDKKITDRPKDAHDILGTFEIVSDAGEMRRIPKDENEFLDILLRRHKKMMEFRPEVNPGEWKKKNNRAGNTSFVEFNKVEGTLKKAFSLIHVLPPGLARAGFMMLVVSEIHPFTDGNGRIGRIMMNAELEAVKAGSIIIPNVFREDYLVSLKAISKQKRFGPFIKMLQRSSSFSSSIDFSNYQKSLTEIKERNWFLLPSEGKIIDV